MDIKSRVKELDIGFSLEGLVAFVLMILPNIIALVFPSGTRIPSKGVAPAIMINITNISQRVMVTLLVFIINKRRQTGRLEQNRERSFIAAAGVCLAAYYIVWIIFYLGVASPWLLLGMAVAPTIYYIVVSVWLKNYPALILAFIFGSTYIINTVLNFL